METHKGSLKEGMKDLSQAHSFLEGKVGTAQAANFSTAPKLHFPQTNFIDSISFFY